MHIIYKYELRGAQRLHPIRAVDQVVDGVERAQHRYRAGHGKRGNP